MTMILQGLAADHPDLMTLTSLGTTYEGRSLWAVKISADVTHEHGRPQVLFIGAHHGNEKPGMEVCLRFIQYLMDTYPLTNASGITVRHILNTTEINVIPMVNPDGYTADQRKNLEPNHGWFGHDAQVTSIGVDINRNYGFKWNRMFLFPQRYIFSTGIMDKSQEYRGPYPFSTAEASAVRSLVTNHSFSIAVSYHTYGQEILYPWGYTRLPPHNLLMFRSIGENISKIDGYDFFQSIHLYPTVGDACDWLYGDHGVYAFTIELGTSYEPTNPWIVDSLCESHISVNLYLCERAAALAHEQG